MHMFVVFVATNTTNMLLSSPSDLECGGLDRALAVLPDELGDVDRSEPGKKTHDLP